MEYRDHPLLEGFRDQPDEKLLECAIAQLEYAAWVGKGAKFEEEGLAPGIANLMRTKFAELPRAGLEKLLYHAIVAAVEEDRKARSGKDSRVPGA